MAHVVPKYARNVANEGKGVPLVALLSRAVREPAVESSPVWRPVPPIAKHQNPWPPRPWALLQREPTTAVASRLQLGVPGRWGADAPGICAFHVQPNPPAPIARLPLVQPIHRITSQAPNVLSRHTASLPHPRPPALKPRHFSLSPSLSKLPAPLRALSIAASCPPFVTQSRTPRSPNPFSRKNDTRTDRNGAQVH